MNRVLSRLWIGDRGDLVEPRTPLLALGFSGVLDLRDGEHPGPPDVEVHRLRNRDGDPWTPEEIEKALDFVADKIRRGAVLIACEAGISRSVCMTVGYLVRCGWDPPGAYALVKAARPKAAPMREMLAAVLEAVTCQNTSVV